MSSQEIKDFSKWYQDTIFEAEVVDQSPTRGCFVIRPYGFAIWELIQKELDRRIKGHGAQNAYFPLLIPEEFLKREAKHVEGFSPELAVVTHAGGKELDKPYVIRPTSETIIYSTFARWINSWRDLPLKINQWANVVRWEMRPRAFLRTAEFLWQEGHAAYATREEAVEDAMTMLNEYKTFVEDFLAIPIVAKEKTATERFAGADHTFGVEGLMRDGKALQMGTTHLLSHSFPETFGIKYQDESGKMVVPWCTSWGVSTRLMGGLFMAHGDATGLILPPKIAPIQVVIIPIGRTDDQEAVLKKANELHELLTNAGIRSHLETNKAGKRPGALFFHWEQRGVPLRIELGPRDLANNSAMIVDRLEQDKNKRKTSVELDGIASAVQEHLKDFQTRLFQRAVDFRDSHWYKVTTFKEIADGIEKNVGFYQSGWCENAECEAKLKEIKASIRSVLDKPEHETCFCCGKKSTTDVLIAKAY